MSLETDRHRLHMLLQKALEIELFTIGPYLTALYSIREGTNKDSADIVKSVAMEEMLHMALVANVLNAVGGRPRLCPELVAKEDNPRLTLKTKRYPANLPYVDRPLEISLRAFSERAIRDFREIERPHESSHWRTQAPRQGRIESIGQFYDEVFNQLIAASSTWGEEALFIGCADKQISADDYYGGGGDITPVFSLADAKDALSEVAQQGEGRRYTIQTGDSERFGQPKEVAHYYRFEEILAGRRYAPDDEVNLKPSGEWFIVDWHAVYPMADNPSASKVKPDGVSKLLRAFERAYGEVLCALHVAFNSDRSALRGPAIAAMNRVREASVDLLKMNSKLDSENGPPFWFVELVEKPPRESGFDETQGIAS